MVKNFFKRLFQIKSEDSPAQDVRVGQILEMILQLSSGNLETRGTIAKKGDELDAIIEGMNMLAEELQVSTETLTKTKDYLDNIIHSTIDTIIVVNPDFTIRTVNQAALNLLGYKVNELIGQPIAKIVREEEQKVFQGSGLEELIEKGFVQGQELTYRAKDGREIPMFFSGSVMRDSEGTLEGIVCVAQDITERKQAEEQIKQTNEELVASYKELKETQSQLIQSAKLASVGELATWIAHELNQPLMVIRANSQLELRNDPENLNSREAYATFKKIEECSGRMMVIINNLKNYAYQSSLETEFLKLNETLENSLSLCGEQFKLSNIKLEKQYDPQIPNISVNRQQLEQVFINMLTNAKDILEGQEGAVLTIQTEFRDRKNKPDEVIVRFIDNGKGIPKTTIDKIFDPFFTTKEPGKGTGLGLSISLKIIQNHHGQINVTSTENEGTTFEIVLPV